MKTIEQKAKAYDEALKVLHKYDGANIMFSQSLKEEMFPELKESEDESIRKKLISYFSSVKGFSSLEYNYGITGEDAVAWLEKQGTERKQLYVRFGDIPSNEKSKIYRGEEEIGEENGVSVYPAFELNGNIVLGLTLPITRTTLYTQQHLLEYDNRPCYLVSGDYVGSGTDGEPLIRNISIIKRLDNYRIKEIEKQGEHRLYVNDNAKEMFIKALERVEEQNNKGYKLTDCDKNSWWEDFKNYTSCTIEQKPTCILDNSESNVKFPFKAKVKSNGKIVTIQGGQLSMDCKKYGKYQSNVEDGYKVYKPEDLELVCNIEQKSNDKVEPKFNVGDWIAHNKTHFVFKILKITPFDYEVVTQLGYHYTISSDSMKKNYHLWSIVDAKDGDILAVDNVIYIYKRTLANHIVSYCKLINGIFESTVDARTYCEGNTCTHPATKEQRDLLFQKIKKAGYEWDVDKKELKKIENKSPLLSDFFKAEYERGKADAQKFSWSEEDKRMIETIISHLERQKYYQTNTTNIEQCQNWLKSLKDEVLPKQEWSEDDEKLAQAKKDAYNDALDKIEYHSGEPTFDDGWDAAIWYLKKRNAQPQSQWKPSESDILLVERIANGKSDPQDFQASLCCLIEQLKKLREE